MDKETEAHVAQLQSELLAAYREVKAVYNQSVEVKANPTKNIFLFRGMYADLKEHYNKFKTTYSEICNAYKAAKMESVYPTANDKAGESNCRKYYFESVAVYEDIMNPVPVKESANSTIQLNATMNESRLRSCIPDIKMPKFDGDVKNWVFFRDTYKSLVHTSDILSPMEKYHHLVGAVSGTARTILKAIPFLEDNYTQAWDALVQHYDNKRLLAVNYLKPLLEFKPLTGKPTTRCLKSFLAVAENVAAFKRLDIPNVGDFILFLLGIRCLDPTTRIEFERENDNLEFPSFEELTKFIKREVRTMELSCEAELETIGKITSAKGPKGKNANNQGHKVSMLAQRSEPFSAKSPDSNQPSTGKRPNTPRKKFTCVACNLTHSLYGCSKFRDATPSDKLAMLNNFKGCFNCLAYDHTLVNCKSVRDCDKCHQQHHTWLHVDKEKPQQSSSSNALMSTGVFGASETEDYFGGLSNEGQVLLATAVIQIKDARDQFQPARAILDSGSQLSFATNRLVQQLGFKPLPCSKSVSGIGQTMLQGLKGKVPCVIRPTGISGVQLTTEAVVVSTITTELPQTNIHADFLARCQSFKLADPTFWKSTQIDFLLGADLYYHVLTGAPITLDPNQPKLIPTVFGHVVAGKFRSGSDDQASCLFAQGNDLPTIMNRFWEVEEVKVKPLLTTEETMCEQHFAETHNRLPTGRYVVSLPIKTPGLDLSSSKHQALSRFINLENKLRRQPALSKEYHNFMREYLDLGHMRIAAQPGKYYIPHHPVTKIENGKMKIRVVFDASAVTSQGSLNDHLMVGPKLQLDISDILLNFRQYEVVFVTDAVKMFRQTLVKDEDCAFQHIFWRFDSAQPIEEYELSTVTYGLASSPYQSLKVIRQLVHDEGAAYPLASEVLLKQIYVDDILAGAHSLEGALELQRELIELMGKGCFQLSKWMSNRKELLQTLSSTRSTPHDLDLVLTETVKILGLQYCPIEDVFTYKTTPPSTTITKRAILSATARIYDPLGYLAPVVFLAKTILQETWLANCEWDDKVPETTSGKWQLFTQGLPLISRVKIPRLIPVHKARDLRVLGFCDASNKGYAAAVYLRTTTASGDVQVQLVKAKTRLAPKAPMTVPRLELNGALLLATIYESVQPFLQQFSLNGQHWFTDSTVVLGWLKMNPGVLKVYVAHRVVAINEILDIKGWRHIRSEENPTDCASRGLEPSAIATHELWWSGPQWLKLSHNQWPKLTDHVYDPQGDPEVKETAQSLLTQGTSPFLRFIESFSSYHRLLRSCAVLRRFCWWLKTRQINRGTITVRELKQSQTTIIKFIQAQYFGLDKPLDHLMKTKAKHLDPFLDEKGVVRVGGRLQHAPLSYLQKHPILLPGQCHFTRILIDHYHESYFHIGPTTLQSLIQNQFWILSARNTIRKRLHQCLGCLKKNPKPEIPKMGNLPASRFVEGRAFINVGIDYGGPFLIRASLRRNAAQSKSYLCLFVCLATKALHLELVSSGTTEAFLAALDRFISRRGKPAHLYSDNGRNFVGADRELRNIIEWLKEEEEKRKVHQRMAIQGIDWSFNPPLSPHFGGIWEAGIRSVKTLLSKAVSQTPLTFEELATIFARVEAILNSRPLCPLYSDVESLDVLTPGHFLVGGPLVAPPEMDLLDCRENVLSRWQLVKQKSQLCWKRWRNQYLATLQQRVKWCKPARNLAVGDLVLLRDVNTSPQVWPLARVVDLHPGEDGIVRVITVKTSSGTYKRSSANVIPLYPILNPPEDQSNPYS